AVVSSFFPGFLLRCHSLSILPISPFDTPTTALIYTLSLHDALPISRARRSAAPLRRRAGTRAARAPLGPADTAGRWAAAPDSLRSEEHTSELQSHLKLVCRLLLEKKNGYVSYQ